MAITKSEGGDRAQGMPDAITRPKAQVGDLKARPSAAGRRTQLSRLAWAAFLNAIPRGGALPEESWRGRHRGITILLWAHVIALPLIAMIRHRTPGQALLVALAVAVLAAGACVRRFSLTTRSALATLGLVSSSAILVDLFDGVIEMHFHYFVVIAVVALYQAWWPYLLALGFVVFQHAIVGVVAPQMVYDHMDAQMHPWTWALIHGGFILAESVTCLMYWRISEDALDQEREARARAQKAHDDLERAHQDLTQAQVLAGIGSWDWEITSNSVRWSDQLYVLAGLDRETFVPSVTSFLDLIHPEDRERAADLINQAVANEMGLDYEVRLVRRDGEARAVHALAELEVSADGPVRMFGTVHDVTERKALQEEIERLAFHDPLTGVANRRLFLDRLEHALDRQRRSGHGCGVLFMDLDDFKKVNDAHGHGAGDQLLRVVAGRLVASVRPVDTVARLGGDEFAVLLEEVDLETSTRLAERLETELCQPIQLQEGATVSIRVSIGMALAEGDVSADDILRKADAVMYAVKVGAKSHTAMSSP